MTNKIAFLFPGQGSQYVGMGKELVENYSSAANVLERANSVLDFDIKKLCFEGPVEELNDTRNTQPAIYTVSMMVNEVLREHGLKPSVVAGHSLGEYTALAVAGVFSFEEGLRLVRKRGIFMNNALPAGQGTMAAVIGLDNEQILSLCQKVNGICEVANFNSPQQIVISGEVAAVKEAIDLADREKAKKVVQLDVSGPFHSSLMMPAREKLKKEIDKLDFNEPQIPIIANVTADYVTTSEEIRQALIEQLTKSVRWVDSIKLMISNGVDTFIEVGPGRVLKGLMRRIDKSVKAFNVEDKRSLEKLLLKINS